MRNGSSEVSSPREERNSMSWLEFLKIWNRGFLGKYHLEKKRKCFVLHLLKLQFRNHLQVSIDHDFEWNIKKLVFIMKNNTCLCIILRHKNSAHFGNLKLCSLFVNLAVILNVLPNDDFA